MRNEINLTDELIEAAFDDTNCGITIDDISFTRETLDDFRSRRNFWNERGEVVRDTDTEFWVERAQSFRGQPRKDVYVVDFGSVRGILSI